MIRARTSGGTKAVAGVHFRALGGTGDVFAVSLRRADGLKRVFTQSGTLTVSAEPASVSGYAATGGIATITTNATIAQPTGGAAAYTHAWVKLSDDGGTWSIQNATSQSTRFSCASVGAEITYTATFRCTVTDSVGGTGTVDVLATASNLGNLYL